MKIEITNGQLTIAGTLFNFPFPIGELKKILGEARHTKKKYNHVYTWDESGICAFAKDGNEVQSIALFIQPADYDYAPQHTFSTGFLIEKKPYADYYQQHHAQFKKSSKYSDGGIFVTGDVSIFYDIEENEITSVCLEKHIVPPAKVYSDKYAYKKIAGEKIEFADFNFKLAVIQELMYNKKLIEPEFDLYEFVDNNKEREIDVEKEGYAFIPEVIDYFKKLEIDKKFAGEVEEILQDGGDDIYGHVLRFWDGEDDTFCIRNFEDIKHFNNLKKMNLFYSEHISEAKAFLAQHNIEVEML